MMVLRKPRRFLEITRWPLSNLFFSFVGTEAIESIKNPLRCNRTKEKLNPISFSTNLLRGKGNLSPYVQKVQSMKLHKTLGLEIL